MSDLGEIFSPILSMFGMKSDADDVKKERRRLEAESNKEKATALEGRRSSLLQQKSSLSKTYKNASSAGGTPSASTKIKNDYTGTLLG